MPVATIKFYLREGLLHPGVPTARNQADYGEKHVARLRLTRILTGVGQLSLASVREVFAAIDDPLLSCHGLCCLVNAAMFSERPMSAEEGASESARAQVDDFIDKLGWRVGPDAPGRVALAQALDGLQGLGWGADVGVFGPYAAAVERLACFERDSMPTGPAETVVAQTILFEVALVTLRRMAQEHSWVS